MLFICELTEPSALLRPDVSPPISIVIPHIYVPAILISYKASITSCVAFLAYSHSSLLYSINISFTKPMLNSSKSDIDIPSCTTLSKYKGVLSSLSISPTLFLVLIPDVFQFSTCLISEVKSHKYQTFQIDPATPLYYLAVTGLHV